MSEKLIVTYDKSQEDVPVLMVGREGYSFGLNPSINVIKVITGDEAEQMYRNLTLREPELMKEVLAEILGKPRDEED